MPSLTPRDVGRRVVVRHRLPVPDPVSGASASDLLGVLEAWDAGVLHVREPGGGLRSVPESAVVAAKVVPARPVARREVRALEAAAALAWRADEEERLGGWLLRAAGGFTGRANSCLPLGGAPGPVPAAVAAVEDWYAQRGLPPRFQVPEPLGSELTPYLDSIGWRRWNEVLVLTRELGPLAEAVEAAVPPDALPPVEVSPAPAAAWLEVYHYRGSPLPAGARSVLERGDRVGFASVVDAGGRTIAVARGAVTAGPDGRHRLGVTAVEVVPDQRRRGLGTHLLGGLCRWAAPLGAESAYLQVAEENAGARSTYGRLGLVEHHRYHYRGRS